MPEIFLIYGNIYPSLYNIIRQGTFCTAYNLYMVQNVHFTKCTKTRPIFCATCETYKTYISQKKRRKLGKSAPNVKFL